MWKITKEQPEKLPFETKFGNIRNLEYFPAKLKRGSSSEAQAG
jgi:hypothetical protein